jgi:hypothetical protein
MFRSRVRDTVVDVMVLGAAGICIIAAITTTVVVTRTISSVVRPVVAVVVRSPYGRLPSQCTVPRLQSRLRAQANFVGTKPIVPGSVGSITTSLDGMQRAQILKDLGSFSTHLTNRIYMLSLSLEDVHCLKGRDG